MSGRNDVSISVSCPGSGFADPWTFQVTILRVGWSLDTCVNYPLMVIWPGRPSVTCPIT